jgi:hypothetical protein
MDRRGDNSKPLTPHFADWQGGTGRKNLEAGVTQHSPVFRTIFPITVDRGQTHSRSVGEVGRSPEKALGIGAESRQNIHTKVSTPEDLGY